ncbi:hypothetical protein HanPSC8_Chr15g0672071 [Helianthus annuus]|nr:hypothetical protein HanPSC8_Chr15g0672071 [Helianthus annuus]
MYAPLLIDLIRLILLIRVLLYAVREPSQPFSFSPPYPLLRFLPILFTPCQSI